MTVIIHQAWCQPPAELPWPHEEVHVCARDACAAGRRRLIALSNAGQADERDRMGRFRFAKDRRRYLIGRGLLRSLLGHYLDLAPQGLRFGTAAAGKPHLASVKDSCSSTWRHSGEIRADRARRWPASESMLKRSATTSTPESWRAHFFRRASSADLENAYGTCPRSSFL